MANVVEYILNLKNNMSPALEEANSSVKKLDMSMGGIASTAIKIGSAIGAVAGIREIAKLGMDAEQTRIQFDVLLGSQEKSIQLRKEMDKYAASTPYEKGDMYEAAKMMLSFNIAQQDIMPNMKMLGDIAMGNKEKLQSLTLAFSQVSSAGKLQGQDLLQMINAGFNPLQEISKSTGKSMATLRGEMEKGQISVDMVKKAFASATSEGGLFYGMTEKIGQTAAGKLSTLQDGFKEVLLKVYDIFSPLLSRLLDVASKVIGSISNGIDYIKKSISSVSSIINSIVTPIRNLIKAISDDTKEWLDYINVVFSVVKEGIMPAFAAVFGSIVDAVAQVVEFVKHSELLKDIFKVIGWIVTQVFKLIGGLISALKWAFDHIVMPILNVIEKAYRFIKSVPAETTTTIKSREVKAKSVMPKMQTASKTGEIAKQDIASKSQTPSPKTKVEGQKNINIHIAYNAALIDKFTISTTNIKEGMGSLKDKVSEILVGATHDALMVADY